MKLAIKGKGSATAYPHKDLPKSKFTTVHATVNHEEVEVRVTGLQQTRYPAYSYFMLDGQVWYVKGNLAGLTCKAVVPQFTKPGEGFDLDDNPVDFEE